MGFGFLLIALAPTLALKCTGAALAATGGPIGDLATATLMQQQPDEHRGKLNSFGGFLGGIGFATGLAVAPLLFNRTGGADGIAVVATCMITVGLPGVIAGTLLRKKAAPVLLHNAETNHSVKL
jgi:MFS family permease